MNAEKPRCLWIARELPFPLDSGDRIYSAGMARSLAAAGVDLHFVALESDSAGLAPTDWGITWHVVPGRRRKYAASIFSTYPLAAAAHATNAFRRKLDVLLDESWDFVVFEHFGSGWALREFGERISRMQPRPVTAYISHNYESTLARSIVGGSRQNLLRKAALWQNALKIARMERQLVRGGDLVTSITEEDANTYTTVLGAENIITLTPGYSGSSRNARVIDTDTPRHVILVGSFRWVVKQENLRQLVRCADPLFAAAGITLDVVGTVPDELERELSRIATATRFHGFVDDLDTLFASARVALVPEVMGGGFKLKFLDYFLSRVPVASLRQALNGLPAVLAETVIAADDLEGLMATVVSTLDDEGALNLRQDSAHALAKTLFDWKDRGRNLARALEEIDNRRVVRI